jgi:threonine/homoserine/homoserine lactone efflux protein
MNILEFAGEVVVLSASGVLSPGPLFLANLIYGSKQGYYTGIKIANGHVIVEFLLITLLSLGIFGLSHFAFSAIGLKTIGLIGGLAIILFSISQILNIIKKNVTTSDINRENKKKHLRYGTTYLFLLDKINRKLDSGPLIIGVIFTALNPFFLIWWVTVGLKLISDSVHIFGIIEGVIILFLFHVWMDYAWLAITAYLISKGRSIFKMRFYNFFIACLSVILTIYGFYLSMTNIA